MNMLSNYPKQTDRVGTKIVQHQRSRTVLREDKDSNVLITTDGKYLYVAGEPELPPYTHLLPKEITDTCLYHVWSESGVKFPALGMFDRGATTLIFEVYPKTEFPRYYLASEVKYSLVQPSSTSMLCLASRPVMQICTRFKDGEEFPLTRNQTVEDALYTMLYCDFDFGAGLQHVYSRSLATVTRVMGCVDVAIYYGDIDILVQAARAFLSIKQEGNTDYVNHLGTDVSVSNSLSRGVLLRAFPELERIGASFFKAKLEDLCTAVVMYKKGEVGLNEISSLL